MFPDFGHKCPSVPGMTSSVFIFLSLQLTQMLRLETPALLASSGTACDGPRDKTGYGTWNCFSFQQTVLSICIPGSQNPRGKAWESTATQRGHKQRCEQRRDTAFPLVYLARERRKPFRQKSKQNKGEARFWSALLENSNNERSVERGQRSFIFAACIVSFLGLTARLAN